MTKKLILPATAHTPQEWAQRKQKERYIEEHMPDILDNIQGALNQLIARCDVIDECLKMTGFTDEQFKTAVQTVSVQQQLLQSQMMAAQQMAQQIPVEKVQQ